MQQNANIDPRLMEFCEEAYMHHDAAHNLKHALRVYENALEIIKRAGIELTAFERTELQYVAMLHDARDHKAIARGYSCVSEQKLRGFLAFHLGSCCAKKVLHIFDNCSWSKRKSSIALEDGDWMRRLLQDADWIDALGEIGLERCIEYNKVLGGSAADVCAHIREKLLLIAPELNFAASRRIVAEKKLEEPLRAYLALHE